MLYTIGYQGRSSDEFLNKLKQHGITALIDIRGTPHSRKPGFSMKHLAEMAAENSMEYHSFQSLGSPPALRKKLRQNANQNEFMKAFMEHLASQQPDLHGVANISSNTRCCLLCYERDADSCHRKIVASEIAKLNKEMSVIHL